MTDEGVPPEIAHLVGRVLNSMNHVDVLLYLWSAPHRAMTIGDVAAGGKVLEATARAVLQDLQSAGLVREMNGCFLYAASGGDADAVDALARMYQTRPVTLVRAVYAR